MHEEGEMVRLYLGKDAAKVVFSLEGGRWKGTCLVVLGSEREGGAASDHNRQTDQRSRQDRQWMAKGKGQRKKEEEETAAAEEEEEMEQPPTYLSSCSVFQVHSALKRDDDSSEEEGRGKVRQDR